MTPPCDSRERRAERPLRHPKNANVGAMIALAGIGMDATQLRPIIDPIRTADRHDVEAEDALGRFEFPVEGNALPGNPASSVLSAMSLVRAARNPSAPVSV